MVSYRIMYLVEAFKETTAHPYLPRRDFCAHLFVLLHDVCLRTYVCTLEVHNMPSRWHRSQKVHRRARRVWHTPKVLPPPSLAACLAAFLACASAFALPRTMLPCKVPARPHRSTTPQPSRLTQCAGELRCSAPLPGAAAPTACGCAHTLCAQLSLRCGPLAVLYYYIYFGVGHSRAHYVLTYNNTKFSMAIDSVSIGINY